MWIYLKQQPRNSNNNEISKSIFNYGTEGISTKPQVSYVNRLMTDGTANTDKYRISFFEPNKSDTISENTTVDLELNSQKWNNLFFNYNNNSADLFVNGVLDRTVPNNKITNFDITDKITLGDNKGLDGFICNISYYTNPVNEYEIVNNYNVYQNMNPPMKI